MKKHNKTIIFALLLIVTILFISTNLVAAKETKLIVKGADISANRVAIYTTFVPETIEINAGENITWVNLKRPKEPSVLVSDDGLWKDTTLYYGKAFSYTFEETGTYTFSLETMPEAKATVIVT